MKTLQVVFTDLEFQKLKKAKMLWHKSCSWHAFLVRSLSKGTSVHYDLKKCKGVKDDK